MPPRWTYSPTGAALVLETPTWMPTRDVTNMDARARLKLMDCGAPRLLTERTPEMRKIDLNTLFVNH